MHARPDKLRVLIVEDQPLEAEMMARALGKGGYDLAWNRVDTEAAYLEALKTPPDIILSDYHMPQFSGLHALAQLKQLGLDIPFILVTGSIGEERAVEMMRLGADDYLLKDRLERLSSAVDKSLREGRERAARRNAEGELEALREQLKSIVSALPDVVWSAAFPSNRMLYVSNAAAAVFGWTPGDFYDGRAVWRNLIHCEDRPRMMTRWEEAAQSEWYESEYRIVKPTGEVRWIQTRGRPVSDASGKVVRIDGIARDVTERREQEQKIAHLSRIHAVMSGINAAIVRIRDRQELFQEACRIAVEHGGFGIAWIGTLEPDTLDIVPLAFAGIEAESLATCARNTARSDTQLGGGLAGRAIREKRPVYSNDLLTESSVGGERRKEAIRRGLRSAVVLPLLVEGIVVGCMSMFVREANFFNDDEIRLLTDLAADISFALDHISKAEKIEYLAYYDALTGLANRTLFHERLEQAIAAASREQRKLALVVQDIERFKAINDTLGRQAGDALLRQIAHRMRSVATDPDRLGRIGADHFAVLVPDVTTEEELARRAGQRMDDIYGRPFRTGDVDLRISARLGIAMYPEDGADADALFRNAEAAVKKAKASGERMLFYTQAMTDRVAEKLNLESKLRNALEKEEFVLHYQPKVQLQTRAIVGVEALIRWQSAEFGLVPPSDFIPLLEETGLILDVGAWALRRAVTSWRHWVELGIPAPRIAVNVSAVQMRQRDFVRVVEEALNHGGPLPAIDLEITESLLMENLPDNVSKLQKVRELGVGIAIDDFGTGYSSLAYLAKLPVNALKIDRSFVSGMLENMTIVSTIISLAHSLDLKVIAEGVESEDQAKLLTLLKCDEMQGYLVSKPIPSEALCEFLRSPRAHGPLRRSG